MARAGSDPRDVITPDAFSVAPELLGMPLARPWRRGLAMAIDLTAIVILGQMGWFFLGLGIAALFFRSALGPAGVLLGRYGRRVVFGSLGTFALTITLVGGWLSCFSDADDRLRERAAEQVLTASGLGEAGATVVEGIAVARAETEPAFREAATSFGRRMQSMGMEEADIRAALEEIAAKKDAPWGERAVNEALASIGIASTPVAATPTSYDSLAIAYAAALQAGDSARRGELRGPLGQALAAEQLETLRSRNRRLATEKDELEADLERERDKGLINLIARVADEVGIGFGWAGLYFTLFLALWGGRTPGKRLLGIRVLRLDGKPIGVWAAFNRFGGYAASIFTGLLGFIEMFWDDNRQALHDRIASTVVVRDDKRSVSPRNPAGGEARTVG